MSPKSKWFNMDESKLKIILPLLFRLIQNCSGSGSIRIDPLVYSKVGLLRGLREDDFTMFLGIPYAIVDINRPFGPAVPHPGFHETFDAYDDSAMCPQVEEVNNTVVGTLDCLHLNIYVPNSAYMENLLPVLVWIHGGGFSFGSFGRHMYGPRYLVKQDVLLVTLNYRLGPYGFMCLDTPDVPGNQGLKDQQLALKWIKDNIESFGGNSDKITIFGESAGSASVDFHLIYSKEKLFDKVIMQSGVALCPWAVITPDLTSALILSKHLGYPTEDIGTALSFLSTLDSSSVIASTRELGLTFRPCVEKYFETVERFIYDYPVNMKPNLDNVPILLGHTGQESLIIYEPLAPADYKTLNLFYDNLKESFRFNDDKLIEMEALVRHFYIGDDEINVEAKEGITRFDSDLSFNYPTVRTIQKYLQNGASNIYHYIFMYQGGRNYMKVKINITAHGAAHADELGYLFDIALLCNNPTPEDQLLIDRITTLWANFAKFGNPTPEKNELLPAKWLPVISELLYFMNIDKEISLQTRHFRARMAFWELFYKHNEIYQIGYEQLNK